MTCRYCGMDSRTPSVCEWCHKILAGPNAGQIDAPQPAQAEPVTRRTALTGDVIEERTGPAQAPPAIGLPRPAAHVPGGPPSPRPVVNTYGLGIDSISTTMVQQQLDRYRVPAGEKWERFLALAMPLLLVSVIVVHFWPGLLTFVSMTDMFLVSIFLGATGSIGSYDDEYMDVGMALVLTLLLGPLVALVVYVIVGVVKQDPHWSIISVLGGHMVVRMVVWVAFMTSGGSAFGLMPAFMVFSVASLLGPMMSFAGWILSSFFRPLTD